MEEGAQNPNNPCQVCDPTQDPEGYVQSNAADCKICTDNNDCEPAEKCDNGICVGNQSGCVTDNTCEEGERCIHGECQVPGKDCADDDDCEPGEICDNQQCFVWPTPCPGVECDYGYIENSCECAPPECSNDNECPDGICEGGWCVQSECEDHVSCSNGDICEEGRCKPAVPCQGDTECDSDKVCVDGKCSPAPTPTPECVDNSGCPGRVCVESKCQDAATEESYLAGAGCDCSAVGAGGRAAASGLASVFALFGIVLGRLRRIRTRTDRVR